MHIAYHRSIKTPLGIIHISFLRLHRHTRTETYLVFPITEHHRSLLVMLLVSGILAVLVIASQFQPIHTRNILQRECLELFLCNDTFGHQAIQRIHRTVGIRITVLVAVAELQMRALKQRFAIAQIRTPVITFRRVRIILVHVRFFVVPIRLAPEEIIHFRYAERLVFRIGKPSPHTQSKVASFVQATVHH